jgi:hypothetical protein
LKEGDVRVRTRGNLTTLIWRDRWDVYILTNMDLPPPEGNFCDNSNRPVKPHIIAWYNQHTGYVDSSDHMANTYLINWHDFKWTTKLCFHLLDLTGLNSWILLSSLIKFLTRRSLIKEAGISQDCTTPMVWKPSAVASNVLWLESRHNVHWPAKSAAGFVQQAVCIK